MRPAVSRAMTRRRINQYTVLLLILGLVCALVIYLHSAQARVDPLLNNPLVTKRYVRELRMIGGTANVLAAEIEAWFAGLWQGESLAGTIAFLTLSLTLAFRFLAQHPRRTNHNQRAEETTEPPESG